MESIGIIFIFVGYVIVRIMLGHHITPTLHDRKRYAQLLALVAQKKYAEALPLIQQKLQENEDSAICWGLKATCHLGLREFHQAILYAEKALNLDANLPEIHYQKAMAHLALGHDAEAMYAFDKAVWYSRNQHPEALYHKGLFHLQKQEFDYASEAFQQAANLGHEQANFEALKLQHRKIIADVKI
jgi:tetratricopeptide (TPR) repeat protein